MKKHVVIILCMTSLMTACSSGSSSGGAGSGSAPQNAEEALQKITPEQQASFATWKTQVAKSCDAGEAFNVNAGGNTEEKAGIDGKALLAKNNNSAVFVDGNNVAILTDYDSMQGIADSKSEQTITVNGQAQTISAEAKRDGSVCEVYLFGQKVYETVIAQSFTLGSQVMAGSATTITAGLPQVQMLGASGIYQATQTGVFDLQAQALKPTNDGLALVIKKLGLTAEQAQMFKLATSASANIVLRIAGEPSAVWSHSFYGNLLASNQVLQTAFSGSNRALNLEIRLTLPQFTFAESKNNSDQGNLKLISQISISQTAANTFFYTTQSMQVSGFVPFDQTEAVQCAKDRVKTYFGGANAVTAIQPSVQTMFGACYTFYPDIAEVSYKNGLMKNLIPVVFSTVNPASNYQYNGWDQVLSRLAIDLIRQNEDVQATLDPSGQTRIIPVVSNYLKALRDELSQASHLTQSQDLVYGLGVSWALNAQGVSNSKIGQMMGAVDHAADPFKVSSEKLLNDLAVDPNGHDDLLNFAQALDNTYMTEALNALNLSRDLNYTNFERDIFDQVIQKQISLKELQDWNKNLTTVKTQISNYSHITGDTKGTLVDLSIQWLKAGSATLQDLTALYSAINNVQDPFNESTKTLVQNLSLGLAANKDSLDFAGGMTDEYKRLAVAIRDNSLACGNDSWSTSFFNSVLQQKLSLDQIKAWNDMWSSANAFIQREKNRLANETFTSSADWNRQQVIDVAVKEIWSNTDFTGFESIAALAKNKPVCNSYVDASSQASCAGLEMFSKGSKKFFDPNYNGRYSELGTVFSSYMNSLSDFQWVSLRTNLLDAFFDSSAPIWSNCDQSSFNVKSALLNNQISALSVETDQIKKWNIEAQIQDTIKDCQ